MLPTPTKERWASKRSPRFRKNSRYRSSRYQNDSWAALGEVRRSEPILVEEPTPRKPDQKIARSFPPLLMLMRDQLLPSEQLHLSMNPLLLPFVAYPRQLWKLLATFHSLVARSRKPFQRFMWNLFLQTAYSCKEKISHPLHEIRQLL